MIVPAVADTVKDSESLKASLAEEYYGYQLCLSNQEVC
jgi:hypothetical protein